MARNTKSENATSTEVDRIHPAIATEALAEVKSFADAVQLAQQVYGQENVVVASDVLGDGFRMLENKDALSGVGFFAVSWNFSMGDHGEFVAVKLVTEDDRKLVITDGSTGIYAQLAQYSKQTGRYGGLFVRKGLRRSDYTYTDDKGDEKDAHTYYLDVSA